MTASIAPASASAFCASPLTDRLRMHPIAFSFCGSVPFAKATIASMPPNSAISCWLALFSMLMRHKAPAAFSLITLLEPLLAKVTNGSMPPALATMTRCSGRPTQIAQEPPPVLLGACSCQS